MCFTGAENYSEKFSYAQQSGHASAGLNRSAVSHEQSFSLWCGDILVTKDTTSLLILLLVDFAFCKSFLEDVERCFSGQVKRRTVMAGLFLWSAGQIIRQARQELADARVVPAE
jgi:hypothetical protein